MLVVVGEVPLMEEGEGEVLVVVGGVPLME